MPDHQPPIHQSMEAVHADDREWETLRWPGQWSKMLFHPRADRPTEPNAGLVRYEPGSHHPFHKHDFAQVWYILEGEFRIGDSVYTPGTMLFYLPASLLTFPEVADPYVYLYSRFGTMNAADGKAETWSHGVGAAVSPSTAGTLDATGLFTQASPPVPPAPPADSGSGDTGGGTGGDTGGGDVGTIWL